MELRKIIKSTSFLVTSKVFQFVVGVVKAKIGAVYLGTTGMGIYNQIINLSSMISQVTLLSMNDGLVKHVAEAKGAGNFSEILKKFVRAYSRLIIFSVLIAFVVCLVFAKPLTVFFLGDLKYHNYYLIGITGIPILIINSLSFALLKSYKATREISNANILSSLVSLTLFIPLVLEFRTAGAAVSVAVNSVIILLINNYQARRIIKRETGLVFKDLFTTGVEKEYVKKLMNFAFFGATSGLIYIGSESLCRAIVVNTIGVEKLGIYSPVTAWSNLLTGFVVPAIQVYLFPRFSECKSDDEISGIVNDYFYLITVLMIPFLFISIPFRSFFIQLFYTSEFLEAGNYLPWHFTGLLFFMWWNILAMVLTPTGRIKTHGLFILLMSSLNVAIVSVLVPRIGLYGWMLKFIVSPVIFSAVYFLFLRTKVKLYLTGRNIALMAYVFTVSLLLIATDSYSVKYVLCFLFSAAALLFVRKREWEIILEKAGSLAGSRENNGIRKR